MAPKNRKILEFAGILMGVALLALVIYPSTLPPRTNRSPLRACKSNLKVLSTALEMYSTDWNGLYPEQLSQLTPNYLKTIPRCPKIDRDTYTGSYSLTEKSKIVVECPEHSGDIRLNFDECRANRLALRYELDRIPLGQPEKLQALPEKLTVCPSQKHRYRFKRSIPHYEFFCQGDQHVSAMNQPDYPRYDSEAGLVEKP